jgi:hypothetical protein
MNAQRRTYWTGGLLAGLALALSPIAAAAQIFTPTFMPPRPETTLGVYVSDLGDLAVEGIARGHFGSYDLGLRGGVVDWKGEGNSLTVGGELRNPLALGTAPIDLSLTAGAQVLAGDVDRFGGQLGLSFGHTFVSPGLGVTPYIHPRIALLNHHGKDDDLGAELLGDIGVDLVFAPRLRVRFGAALSDVGADWGIGLAW